MSKSLLSLTRFNISRYYSQSNKPFKKETETKMVVTIAVKIVADHGKQSLQNLMNIGQKKRTGALGIGANGTNTGPQRTIKKI